VGSSGNENDCDRREKSGAIKLRTDYDDISARLFSALYDNARQLQGDDLQTLISSAALGICEIDGIDAVVFVLRDRQTGARFTITYPDTDLPPTLFWADDDEIAVDDLAVEGRAGRRKVCIPLEPDGQRIGHMGVLGSSRALCPSMVAALGRMAAWFGRALLMNRSPRGKAGAPHPQGMIRRLEQRVARAYTFLDAAEMIVGDLALLLMADLVLLVGLGPEQSVTHLVANRELSIEQRRGYDAFVSRCVNSMQTPDDMLIMPDLTQEDVPWRIGATADVGHVVNSMLGIPIHFEAAGLRTLLLCTSRFAHAFSEREAFILRYILGQVSDSLEQMLIARQNALMVEIQSNLVKVTRVFLHHVGHGARDEVLSRVLDTLVDGGESVSGAALHIESADAGAPITAGALTGHLDADRASLWAAAVSDARKHNRLSRIPFGLPGERALQVIPLNDLQSAKSKGSVQTGVLSLIIDPLDGMLTSIQAVWQPLAGVLAHLIGLADTEGSKPASRPADVIHINRNAIRALLDGFPAGVFIVDRAERVIAANKRLYEMAGEGDDLKTGYLPPDIARIVSSPQIQQALELGIVIRQTEVVKKRVGERLLEVTTFPIYDDSLSDIQAVVGIVEDVSPAYGESDSISRVARYSAVGRLTSGLAHDLNNRLSTVLLNAELLLGGVGRDSPQYESVELIRRNAEWMAQAVSGLQKLGREPAFEPADIDINRTIQQALSLLEPYLSRQDVDICYRLQPDLPRIRASSAHLEQVWATLIVNAIDAMVAEKRAGAIQIGSRLDKASEIVVTVSLGGTVVPEGYGHNHSVDKPDAGMGLYGCLQIIQQHGGRMGISYGEHGTCFEIRLPIVDAPVSEPFDPDAKGSGVLEKVSPGAR
jgi:signal transduction histidine kinase